MNASPSGTVTFLFTDIEGSTGLWQEQPAAMRIAHERHNEILNQAIQSNHGYVFQIVGDSFSAAFHNAIDGLNAALAAQRRLHTEAWGKTGMIKVRMGLHTGAAEILADGKYDGYATLATTQRIMSVACGRQVLFSQTAHELCQHNLPDQVDLLDMGEHRLKDIREPIRLYQLAAPDLPQEFPPLKSRNAAPNNLPDQLTSFIGREKQMEDSTRLLASTRMLTFIGPGGTGKTRLALQLAENQLSAFKDGAWFIELAPLTDSAYIVSTIVSAFNLREVQGVPPLTVLIDYLRSKQLLLVLDNCEHLVEACAQLADQLLHQCPGLKLVVSSREALGISGETVYRVPSLREEEATNLFIERATKADSRFTATKENAPFIAQMCTRLDGIPLAIELAAARVKLFSLQQIADRLDDRFKLLTGGSRTALPRQQTLRALIDWSYQTLNETEQRTVRRLTVFSGGWSFEAAEAVVGESDAFDGLAGLVNKSLVNVEEQDGASRYFFLETIRQYAMEILVEAGEANETRTRHLDYFLKLSEQTNPNFLGIDMNWIDKIDAERDNLRTALEWATANDVEKAVRLVIKIGTYWSTHDYISEGMFWYKTILQSSEARSGLDAERAVIYTLLGWTSILIGQHREGRLAAETALSLAKKSNDARTIIISYCTLALASLFLGDLLNAETVIQAAETIASEKGLQEELALAKYTHAQLIYFGTRDTARAKEYFDQSIQLSAETGNRWGTAFQAFGQARLAANLGDLETARLKFKEGTEIAQHIGNRRMVYSNRSEWAHALRENGFLKEAYAIYVEILPGWKDLGHRAAAAHELECIAYILSRREEPEKAVRLLSAAQALRRVIDVPRTRFEDVEYEKERSTLGGMLGEEEFQAQWEDGANLSMDEAIQLAIEA